MKKRMLLLVAVAALLVIGYLVVQLVGNPFDPQSRTFLSWWRGNEATRAALITSQRDACSGAPFILPADGFIGLLYADPRGPYSSNSPHQGIDIFSNAEAGVTPVYAAYNGYVTRESNWVSTLIQRIPDDPLNPGSQVWLYYTHMADQDGSAFIEPAFPPGTREQFVEQGTLLGYTGDYNGASPRPISVHLHFSIVGDNGAGGYLNELEFANTLDPSPYLGLPVSYACSGATMTCTTDPTCN